ncbi:MAG TPA: ABC transporter permease [Gemmatimonadaceae bacterium]|jgi:putative ABC transport system permease protein|nr:ABC transporter permease [Gemmatimonadaceae bacterium]
MRIGAKLYSLLEGVLIAFDAMRVNKVRTGLTVLGIAVGVFVVTVMSAAVHGINEGVSRSIAAAGPTTFFLTRWPVDLNGGCNGSADSCPWRNNRPLTVEQAKAIAELPSIQGVTTHISSNSSIKYADRELPSVSIDAYSPGWIDVDGGDVTSGRDFTPTENDAGANVLLVNPKIVEKLFLGEDPVGKPVRLNGKEFVVIGVYQPLVNAFDNGSKGKLYMPFESAKRRMAVSTWWLDVTVKPRDGYPRDQAMDDVLTTLRSMRHLRPTQQNDFFTSTPEKIMQIYDRVVGVFFLVMITLSAIGLLVGGVGVVAIMMISVTERTSEIGVRKALGATRALILWQFLVEAVTLTAIGASLGLILGSSVAYLIRSTTPIAAQVPPMAIVAALGASAFTGVLFGMIPAVRAARLNPVDALRYE